MRWVSFQHLWPWLQHAAVRLIHGLSEMLDILSLHLWISSLNVWVWYEFWVYSRSEHVAPALRERRCIHCADTVTHHASVTVV